MLWIIFESQYHVFFSSNFLDVIPADGSSDGGHLFGIPDAQRKVLQLYRLHIGVSHRCRDKIKIFTFVFSFLFFER